MFQNREEAGLLLAKKLQGYKDKRETIVFAIPRGGVVVGRQIAIELHLPLKVILVKKIRAPRNPELAIGAIASNNIEYIDWDLALRTGADQKYLDGEIKNKRRELEKKEKKLEVRKLRDFDQYKDLILVDDGIATGATVLAGIKYIKESEKRRPEADQPLAEKAKSEKIILAVPVVANDTYNKLQSEVDEIVALEIPESFGAVGEFYREFPQVSDEEVIKIINSKHEIRNPKQ